MPLSVIHVFHRLIHMFCVCSSHVGLAATQAQAQAPSTVPRVGLATLWSPHAGLNMSLGIAMQRRLLD